MQIRSIAIFSLGDEISPLKSWLIRTYPDRDFTEADVIYNYHHSRARKTIKNVFGILTDRGRIFLTPILGTVQNNERHVCASLACIIIFAKKVMLLIHLQDSLIQSLVTTMLSQTSGE